MCKVFIFDWIKIQNFCFSLCPDVRKKMCTGELQTQQKCARKNIPDHIMCLNLQCSLDISLAIYASLFLVTNLSKNMLCCFIADGMPHFMTIPLILPKMWITVIIFLITIHRLFQNNLLNTTYFANTRIFFLRPSSFLFQF